MNKKPLKNEEKIAENSVENLESETLKKEDKKSTEKAKKTKAEKPVTAVKTEEKKKGKGKLLIILLVLCFAFVGGGVGLYFMLRGTRVNPKVEAVVPADVKYYAGFDLSTVPISLSDDSTDGTIKWEDSTVILQEGTHSYSYKFTPKNKDKYFSKTGKVEITAVAEQLVSISVKTQPTKNSGYTAFETFDAEGMVLEATFDSGSKQEFTTGYEVVYQTVDAETFLAGNTKVTITYAGKSCDVSVGTVAKVQIAEPTITGTYTYSGNAQTPTIATSDRYTIQSLNKTDAGSYNVEVSLKDTQNTEWSQTANKANAKITLVWNIAKANLSPVETNVVGQKYDGNEHSVSVSATGSSEIIYSLTQITKENVGTVAPETNLSRIDVTDPVLTVYYYIKGDKNHNDASGELSLEIVKTTATVSFNKKAYLFIKSTSPANLPETDVKVVGVKNIELIHAGKVNYVYYTNSAATTKTTTAQGAATEGGVPSNIGRYYVVCEFVGNDTYLPAKSTPLSYIIEDVNDELISVGLPGFYWASDDETKFVDFKVDTSANPNTFTFESNDFTSAVIMKINGFYIFENGTNSYRIQISTSDKLQITNTATSEVKEYKKWLAPDFVGTYTYCDPEGDPDEETNYMNIYLEDRELKYSWDYAYWKSGGVVSGNYSGTINLDPEATYEDEGKIYIAFEGAQSFTGVYDVVNETMHFELLPISALEHNEFSRVA